MKIIDALTDFSNARKASQKKQQELDIKRATEKEEKMKKRVSDLTEKILKDSTLTNREAISMTLQVLIEELELDNDIRFDDILADEKASLRRNLSVDSSEYFWIISALEQTLGGITGREIDLVNTDSMDTIGSVVMAVTQVLESK